MFAENHKISLRQLQILLLLDAFGTAVLFLPTEFVQINGQGCWLAVLVGGLVFAGLSLLLTTVAASMPPESTVVEWCRSLFGDLFGGILLVGLGAKLLFDGMLELRLFSEMICRMMLPNTPVWVLSLVLLAVAGALAAQGAECRGRAAEILFFVVLLPLVLVLISVALSAEYGRIRPVELPPIGSLGNSIAAMSIVFQGLVFLYFIFPTLRKPKQARSAVWKSTLVTALLLTVIVFLCLAVYGSGVLSEKLLPTLQMMERVSFTGVFLTRQDVLLLWFWMAGVCVFLSGVLFYGTVLGTKLLRQPETSRKIWLWICLAAVFGASFLPEDLSAAYHLRLAVAPWLNLAYLFVLPLLLLLFSRKEAEKDA